MQRAVKYLIFTFFTAAFLSSCGNEVSLQRYYVENQENKNFITQDFPLSMIEVDKTQFTPEQTEAYNSVDKLNFLGYKIYESNTESYHTELAKVKSILNQSKYNDLMEFSDKGNRIEVKCIGDDDEAEEVVVFGNSDEIGFGIVRILGDDMNPEKMMTLIRAMQNANINQSQVENIMNFFK
ncbi:DUF4252 domain-containing protein [Tamlana crocina]|uniref:DUF4252 domain-containing protein n=1 Tax=Tamlana crocina TaxID=393006 RepID=A0ABX1DIS5_9FLAO|nr:DUF4252 domain-containing protein [Tamlana crocina]NJX16216.1 DUF4252 domain-containing protein [Tamlana crocina]